MPLKVSSKMTLNRRNYWTRLQRSSYDRISHSFLIPMLSAAELHAALSASPKHLDNHSMMFDGKGGALYDDMCQSPLYYAFHHDFALHKKAAPEIASLVGKNAVFADFGCGTCEKSEWILKALDEPKVFVPLDIDAAMLNTVKDRLNKELPTINVEPMVGDYYKPVDLPKGHRMGLFSLSISAFKDEGKT